MPDVSAEETSYLTAQQAAVILGVSLRTVERMQSEDTLTPVYLPRKRRRFKLADVERLAAGDAA